MNVEVREEGGAFIVAGELDLASAREFGQTLAARINGSEEVVLDLAGLEFMDSEGFRTIVLLARSVCPRGLLLRWPRDNVLRVLDLLEAEKIEGIRIQRR